MKNNLLKNVIPDVQSTIRNPSSAVSPRLTMIDLRSTIFFLLLVFSVSCAGLGGGSTAPGGDEGGSGISAPSPGGDNLLPISSLPPAQLTKGHVVAAAQDESGITPVVGYDGAVSSEETNGDYQIVVSQQEITDSTDVCSKADVACCDSITSTGSFECPVQGENTSTHYVYVMKKDTQELSEAIAEPVNPNILYLRKAPKAVASLTPDALGTNYYGSITEGLGAKISEVDGMFKVMNEFDSNYSDAGLQVTESSTELAADVSGNVAVKGDDWGLDLFDIDRQSLAGGDPLDVLATGVRVTVPDTEKYNKLKLSGDNRLRFIRKPNAAFDTEIIYDALAYPSPGQITYIDRNDTRTMGITIKNTIAFDVETSGWTLVLFEDGSDQLRLRLVNNGMSLTIGGDTPLPITCTYNQNNICNFRDISIYKNTSDIDMTAAGDGKALLLDSDKNRVGIVSYNFPAGKVETSGWIKLGDGKTPVAMALSADKKNAFIANQGDATITLLSLFDKSGNPFAADTIRLKQKIINIKDVVGDKNMAVKLKDIAFTQKVGFDPYLMVSAEGLKSNLVINLKTVKKVSPTLTELTTNMQLTAPAKSSSATSTKTDDMLSIGISEGL